MWNGAVTHMARSRSNKNADSAKTASPLIVRLDRESKQLLADAAELRQLSISEYVRTVTVPQAKREIRAAREQVLALTPGEQQLFWTALGGAPKLTAAQHRLGAVMRGET
ncbi:MAG TPA: DUF1778 domain-containing protein [Pirellulales bacterium]|jgi:uncharacterized protein (DUF1778 family)|nr:DUF1778 domain-containing protein [Pirellulales bacterium]